MCRRETEKPNQRNVLEGGGESYAVSFPVFYSVYPDCYFPLLLDKLGKGIYSLALSL